MFANQQERHAFEIYKAREARLQQVSTWQISSLVCLACRGVPAAHKSGYPISTILYITFEPAGASLKIPVVVLYIDAKRR